MNIRLTALVTGVTTVAALGVGVVSARPAPAQTTGPRPAAGRPLAAARQVPATAWELSVNALPGTETMSDVVATAGTDAWAVGGQAGDGRNLPLVFRWNGAGWRQVALPELPDLDLGTVRASSSRDVWAFGHSLFDTGPSGGSLLRAMRFDGSRWSVSTIDEDRFVYDADVLGPRNVWLAGTAGYRLPGNILHWDGAAWRPTTLPGEVYGLDMTSARRGWAVGTADGQPAAHRWDGSRWRLVPTPRYSAPDGGGQAQLHDVLALSSTDVWAVGTLFWTDGDDEVHRPIAMHWNGREWSKVNAGSHASGLGRLAPDGAGGVWAQLASTTLLHYRAGEWTPVELPTAGEADTVLSGLANVPGTTTMLGTGFTAPWGAPEDDRSDGVFFTGR